MKKFKGKVLAYAEDCSLIEVDGRWSDVVFTVSGDLHKSIMQATEMSDLRLSFFNIQSENHLPVINIYLNTTHENSFIGSLALFGIKKHSVEGSGGNLYLNAGEAFKTSLKNSSWSDDSFKLIFVPRSANKQITPFMVERIELLGNTIQ